MLSIERNLEHSSTVFSRDEDNMQAIESTHVYAPPAPATLLTLDELYIGSY